MKREEEGKGEGKWEREGREGRKKISCNQKMPKNEWTGNNQRINSLYENFSS